MATPTVVEASSDVVPQGPFGGTGGAPFYDGVGEVIHITITYSDRVIWSVEAKYLQKDANFFDAAHHGSKGPHVADILLDFLDGERLLQVRGTTAPAEHVATEVVTSLTFITTNRIYGPYGAEVGRQFHSSPNGQVVGFFDRSGSRIDAFGTFTDFAHSSTDVVPNGPWGGNGGSEFSDAPADKIRQIDVEYDHAAIISLKVTYDRGSLGLASSKHGGVGPVRGTIKTIKFDSHEYLAQVKGTCGSAHGIPTVVTSLTFITETNNVHGPFGHVSVAQFQTSSDGQILGFFGRSGWLIDKLGAYVGRVPSYLAAGVPTFGGRGGVAFYEGRGEISEIVVTYLRDQLVATLQVKYLQGGSEFVGAVHGREKGGDVARIYLNPPGEYLVQVAGTRGKANGVKDLILSIQFTTNNNKTYGPYGNRNSGTPFASPIFEPPAGRIVGLFGRAGVWLDQIGVIVFQDLID